MNKSRSGFTIVELLIVIVVIAILAAISIVAYNGIQQRARDNIRKADINAIAKALELHYVDYGAFTKPGEPCYDSSIGIDTCDSAIINIGDWHSTSDMRDLLAEGYIQSIPKDPINNTAYHYNYEPWNAGQNGYATAAQAYDLCARLESGGNYCVNKRT
jgi:prepilin-type N-terminal cleavage/methylation domain-containing protein|tara:strand:- start:177 stop:653 length:477 start_codon:yes stop_codon:yes gene_type:complete